jgi:hypothetical protein
MDRTRTRVIAGVLWFFAVWGGWNVAGSVFDVPQIIGPVLGLILGLIVVYDPLRAIWPARRAPSASSGETGAAVKPLTGGRIVTPAQTGAPDPAPGETAPAAGLDR